MEGLLATGALDKLLNNNQEQCSFMLIDLNILQELYQNWARTFPTIQPFFAVKSNPDPIIIDELNKYGSCFDCASLEELKLVHSLGIESSRIIFANTIKLKKDINFAKSIGVKLMTCDSIYEIHKIREIMKEAEIIIRIKVPSMATNTTIPFGDKFGACRKTWKQLLECANELGLQVVGTSFHVGSGCNNPDSYSLAIDEVKMFIHEAERTNENKIRIVDLGGGFSYPIDERISRIINEKLNDDIFRGRKIIAEPGRYMVETTTTIFAQIIGKRIDDVDIPVKYWIFESIYGSFADVSHGYMSPIFYPITNNKPSFKGSIFYGCSCDGSDVIYSNSEFQELEVGDWIYCKNMGAYTWILATKFNGMGFDRIQKVYYHCDKTLTMIGK